VRRDDKMRIDFQKPDPRTILRNGDSLFVFTPKINRVEEYNIESTAHSSTSIWRSDSARKVKHSGRITF